MAGVDILSDSTGKSIVAAIKSTDVAQARISEINAAAESKKNEVLASIPEDYSNVVSEVNQIKGDLTGLEIETDNIILKGTSKTLIREIENIVYFGNYSVNINTNSIGDSLLFSNSPNYETYYFYADDNTEIYVNNSELTSGLYFSICTLTNPTHEFVGNTVKQMYGDSSARYRTIDNNLPLNNNKLVIEKGTMVVFTFNIGHDLNIYMKYNSNFVNGCGYSVTYENNVLRIDGNSISCYFSSKSFGSENSLFELQALSYKGMEVFGEENDYIGPVKLKDEDIKGAKHGGETTDVVKVYTDDGELENGNCSTTKTITVYVESHISDEFKRISVYTLSNDKLTTYSYIKTLKDMTLSRVWGCGIISSKNDNTVAWLNKYPLTDTINSGLGQSTMIATQKGTLVSTQLFVNDGGKKQSVVNFYDYTSQSNRKKLYYYDLYATIPVTSGTEFSNCVELKFN